VSNPIYVGRGSAAGAASALPPARTSTTLYSNGAAQGWTVEKNTASDAALDVIGALPGSQLLLRFAISGAPSDSPYVAFVMPATTTISMYERIVFTARADRPMRLSVQLRTPGGQGQRWQRSVYLDQTQRTLDLPFSDFRPEGSTNSAAPVLPDVNSVLFVIDTVNTRIGSNGQIQLDDVKYVR